MVDDQPKRREPVELNDRISRLQPVPSRASAGAVRDPAQLRELVDTMAWFDFGSGNASSHGSRNGLGQPRTISELAQAFELKRTLARMESDATEQTKTISAGEHTISPEPAPEQVQIDSGQYHDAQATLGQTPGLETGIEEAQADTEFEPPAQPDMPPNVSGVDNVRDLDDWQPPEEEPAEPYQSAPGQVPQQFPSDERAVVVLPERPPTWLQRPERLVLELPPHWQNQSVRLSVEVLGDPRDAGSQSVKRHVLSFLQLVAAAVMGVALYVGITGWLGLERPVPATPVQSTMAPSPAETPAINPKVAGVSDQVVLSPQPQPQLAAPPAQQSVLPFPLPTAFGIYAGSNGQLTELAPLALKIPDHRIQLSAEIRTPSRAAVANGKLAFVVFRRDLLNSAPQTVSVRVVARVARAMRFVNGKAVFTSIEGAWRIRSKAYELRVSPLEGQREMILLQPDPGFVFPAGRYALVLNGYGYDFTVSGAITASEQCLEQSELLSGTVLSECAKS